MLTMIYYCIWDHSIPSHDLLRRAAKKYLVTGDAAASRLVLYPDIDPGIDSEINPEVEPVINPVIDSVQDWEIAEHDGGKPYFPEHPEIHFSISHSGEYWACAIASKEVGLDLQEENATARARKLAKRFFHPHEQAYLKSVDYRAFTRIWAAKESYLKYTGEGIAGGMSHFSVVDEDGRFALRGSEAELTFAAQTVIPFDKDYKMVLTTANNTEYRTEVLRLKDCQKN